MSNGWTRDSSSIRYNILPYSLIREFSGKYYKIEIKRIKVSRQVGTPLSTAVKLF
jgi:hypothetical protein